MSLATQSGQYGRSSEPRHWRRCSAGLLTGLTLAVTLALSACASSPLQIPDDVELSPVSPADVIAVKPGTATGDTVLWGGVILGVDTLADGTQLDILAYPLDRIGRPLRVRESLGRFVAFYSEFLEPVDYAQGRELTVVGTIDGETEAIIGQSNQALPTVRVSDLHLWLPGDVGEQPRVTFGFGINIRN